MAARTDLRTRHISTLRYAMHWAWAASSTLLTNVVLVVRNDMITGSMPLLQRPPPDALQQGHQTSHRAHGYPQIHYSSSHRHGGTKLAAHTAARTCPAALCNLSALIPANHPGTRLPATPVAGVPVRMTLARGMGRRTGRQAAPGASTARMEPKTLTRRPSHPACPGGRTAPPKIATPRPAQPEQGWLRALRVPHRCAAPLASTRAVRAGSFRAQNGERTDTSAGCSARQQQRQDLGLGAAPRKCQLDLRARAQRRQPPPSLSTAPQWPRRTAPFRALFGPIQKSEFCTNAL